MIVTPQVKEFATSCTEQVVHPKPMPTPALTPNTKQSDSGAQDHDKIQTTIDTLKRIQSSTSMISDKDNIDRIIHQLQMDLVYLNLKHGK